MAEQAVTRVVGPKEKIVNTLLSVEVREPIEASAPVGSTFGYDKAVTSLRQLMSRDEKILKCDLATIIDSVSRIVRWALDPGKPNTVFLIPRWDSNLYGKGAGGFRLTVELGYAGMIELVTRDSDVEYFDVDLVMPEDHVRIERGTKPFIEHRPDYKASRLQSPVLAYAVAHFKSGSFKFVVMTLEEVKAIRDGRRGEGYSPWDSHPNEMAKKTAIRRLCKTLVLSPDAAEAIKDDDANDYPQYARMPDDRAASIEAAVADRALPESVPSVSVATAERATIKGAGGVEADDLTNTDDLF